MSRGHVGVTRQAAPGDDGHCKVFKVLQRNSLRLTASFLFPLWRASCLSLPPTVRCLYRINAVDSMSDPKLARAGETGVL